MALQEPFATVNAVKSANAIEKDKKNNWIRLGYAIELWNTIYM